MITIERAHTEDAPALLAAKVDAFSEDIRLYGYGPPGYDSLKDILGVIECPDRHYFKILSGNEVIGGLCAQDMGGGHFNLNSLYVFTDRHNEGAGSTAMRLLFEAFPGVTRWTTETPYLSVRNHHFYEKLGFVKTGQSMPEADGFYLFLYDRKA